ncbi:MAG: hypothetical protein JXR76_17865 [Deltaproteobacteria bacterium]|nr:hypothetical protein [Deltaproteobacteria bacterium]
MYRVLLDENDRWGCVPCVIGRKRSLGMPTVRFDDEIVRFGMVTVRFDDENGRLRVKSGLFLMGGVWGGDEMRAVWGEKRFVFDENRSFAGANRSFAGADRSMGGQACGILEMLVRDLKFCCLIMGVFGRYLLVVIGFIKP